MNMLRFLCCLLLFGGTIDARIQKNTMPFSSRNMNNPFDRDLGFEKQDSTKNKDWSFAGEGGSGSQSVKSPQVDPEARRVAEDIGKISVLLNQAVSGMPDTIRSVVQPLLRSVLNGSELTLATFDIVEEDAKALQNLSHCLGFSDEDLKYLWKTGEGKDGEICRASGCADKRACVAQFVIRLTQVIEPFFNNILGKAVVQEDGSAVLEAGLLLNFGEIVQLVFDKLQATKVVENKLGESGQRKFEQFTKMMKVIRKVVSETTQVISASLKGVEAVALVIDPNVGRNMPPAKFEKLKQDTKNIEIISDGSPGDLDSDDFSFLDDPDFGNF